MYVQRNATLWQVSLLSSDATPFLLTGGCAGNSTSLGLDLNAVLYHQKLSESFYRLPGVNRYHLHFASLDLHSGRCGRPRTSARATRRPPHGPHLVPVNRTKAAETVEYKT